MSPVRRLDHGSDVAARAQLVQDRPDGSENSELTSRGPV